MVLSSTSCPTRASNARQISSVVANSPRSACPKNGAKNSRSSSRRRLPTSAASLAGCLHCRYSLPVVARDQRMNRRFRDPTVARNVLGFARLYQRVINDQPTLTVQWTRIGGHTSLDFLYRQIPCCSCDPCHFLSFSACSFTSFILSQHAI